MSARHHPEPWTFGTRGDGSMWMSLGDPSSAPHAQFDWHGGEANARLIAAAPDLLSIAQRWAAIDGGAWHVERHASEKSELLADTKAAIAKAEAGHDA